MAPASHLTSTSAHSRAGWVAAGPRRVRSVSVTRASQSSSPSVSSGKEAAGKIPVAEVGSFSVMGTSRKVNEDRYDYKVVDEVPEVGGASAFFGVYDGHGGAAVAEWLERRLSTLVGKSWTQNSPEKAVAQAFLEADKTLLQPKGGFLGAFGERGVGGSKCGSTGAVALIFQDKTGTKLLSANVGDSRVVVIRNGKAVQLTEDHVPDSEDERKRIESENPNPKLPLVRFVGDTWRVGGILALSRAFGDAYMKGSLQFEGIDSGTNYRSGFGVIADPYVSVTDLQTSRGGGGGIDNDELAAISKNNGGSSAEDLAEKLCMEAQKNGSTDDVTVLCIKLDV